MWSCRFWVILHVFHLVEDRKLLRQRLASIRRGKGTRLSKEERGEMVQRWDAFWSEVVINLGYLPLTIHWSLEHGIFNEASALASGVIWPLFATDIKPIMVVDLAVVLKPADHIRGEGVRAGLGLACSRTRQKTFEDQDRRNAKDLYTHKTKSSKSPGNVPFSRSALLDVRQSHQKRPVNPKTQSVRKAVELWIRDPLLQ